MTGEVRYAMRLQDECVQFINETSEKMLKKEIVTNSPLRHRLPTLSNIAHKHTHTFGSRCICVKIQSVILETSQRHQTTVA